MAALLAAAMLLSVAACSSGGENSAGGEAQESTGGAAGTTESTAGEGAADGDTGLTYDGEEVTITYWHTHGDAEEVVLKEQIVPEFEKQFPNIHVKLVRMPYDGLKQQVIQGVSSGTAPDLMRMDIIWVTEFAKLGALVPVDDLPGFAEMKETLFEGALSTNYYEGKYYGLPLNTNCLSGAYTNEDYTKASGYLNGEASVKALETIVQWYDEGILGPATMAGKPDVSNGVFRGEYLLTYQGPWFYTNNKEEDIAKVQAGLLPAGDAGSMTVVGGEDLCMFTSGKNQEAAWVFARFLMGEFAQKAQALGGGRLIPTVKEFANSEEVMAVENMDVYVEQLENAVSRTPHPAWEKMSDKIMKLFQSCLRHEVEPRAALDKLAPEIDALLAEK